MSMAVSYTAMPGSVLDELRDGSPRLLERVRRRRECARAALEEHERDSQLDHAGDERADPHVPTSDPANERHEKQRRGHEGDDPDPEGDAEPHGAASTARQTVFHLELGEPDFVRHQPLRVITK